MEITIYKSTHCMQCKMALKVLSAHGITVPNDHIINIDEQPQFRSLLKSKGLTSLPVIVIDQDFDSAILGFNPDRIDDLIAKYNALREV